MLQDRTIKDFKEIGYKGFIFKKSCKKCVFYNGCSGIDPGYANIWGLSEFKPVKKLPLV